MIKVAICDDCRESTINLKKIVEKYFIVGQIEYITYCYNSGIALLKSDIEFDIVFLDVEMKQIDGIETAQNLRKYYLNTKIVYVTNYRKYQFNAFQVHAFQYIIKPFTEDIVFAVLEDALKYIEERDKKLYFTFYADKEIVKAKVADIFYLEFKERKIQIITKGKVYSINGTLKNVYEQLKPYGFGMPHKSFITNFFNIQTIQGFEIRMKSGDIVPIAQRKSAEFKQSFYEFLHEKYYLSLKG